jgi:hypothetical protein
MNPDIVLAIGAEGGSLTIRREPSRSDGWCFRVSIDESTMYDMLSEEDREGIVFSRHFDVVRSLDEALRQLDAYPWVRLHPMQIHPDYRDEILRAVFDRGGLHEEARWRARLMG